MAEAPVEETQAPVEEEPVAEPEAEATVEEEPVAELEAEAELVPGVDTVLISV